MMLSCMSVYFNSEEHSSRYEKQPKRAQLLSSYNPALDILFAIMPYPYALRYVQRRNVGASSMLMVQIAESTPALLRSIAKTTLPSALD